MATSPIPLRRNPQSNTTPTTNGQGPAVLTEADEGDLNTNSLPTPEMRQSAPKAENPQDDRQEKEDFVETFCKRLKRHLDRDIFDKQLGTAYRILYPDACERQLGRGQIDPRLKEFAKDVRRRLRKDKYNITIKTIYKRVNEIVVFLRIQNEAVPAHDLPTHRAQLQALEKCPPGKQTEV